MTDELPSGLEKCPRLPVDKMQFLDNQQRFLTKILEFTLTFL